MLFGLFGIGNLGNDASLQAALDATRRLLPLADVIVVCGNADVVRRRFGVKAVSMFPLAGASRRRPLGGFLRVIYLLFARIPAEPIGWLSAFRALSRGDHVIVPGTGILDDLGTAPTSVPLALFRWCVVARLRGCRISFLSVGAGPIYNRNSRKLMITATRLAHYRSFRDENSRNYMARLGLNTESDSVTPDVAFSLAFRGKPRAVTSGQPLTVGVGVMNYRGWAATPDEAERIYHTYIDQISEFVGWLLAGGFCVHLVTGDAADRRSNEDVRARVLDAGVEFDTRFLRFDPAGSMEELLEQLSGVDVVVTSRFHGVIGAAICLRPVIAIGYEAKFDLLMKELGLGQYCQRIEGLDVERLKRQFDQLINEPADVISRLLRIDEDYRDALHVQYTRVLGVRETSL